MQYGTRQFVVSLSLLLLFAVSRATAQRTPEVSGVVRDTHGTPQMGVMVELLGAGTSITALTDLQGRYEIRDVLPGTYQLRATAALYLPSVRRRVRLGAGIQPVVNLIMSGLFEEATWISISHSSPDNPEDWKWTLRSPANRPMLRLASDEGGAIAAGVEARGRRGESRGSVSLGASRGGFGNLGEQGTLTVLHHSADHARTVGLRSSVARTETGLAARPMAFSTMLESSIGGLGKHRIDVSVRTFPQVRDSRGNSLTVLAAVSAEQMSIGDFAALEVGSQTQLLTTGATVLISHPFLNVTSRPIEGWTTSYGFSTLPGLANYEDLGAGAEPVPTVIRDGAKLKTDSGWHQEIAAGRNLGRTKIRLAYSHDATRRTALIGRLSSSPISSVAPALGGIASATPLVADVSDGTVRMFAQGYDANGASMAVDVPLSDDLSVSGGYLTNRALEVSRDSSSSGLGRIGVARVQSVSVAFTGRVPRSGTRVSASYRWQPARTISSFAPYETAGSSPYLSIHVRQPLHATKISPAMELTLDGRNLLQEGYESYALARQEATLASALQELRAGLSFSF